MSIKSELEMRLKHAHDRGLVHITGSIVNAKPDATDEDIDDHLIVLNNVLRIRATKPTPTYTA